jgi:putative endonuclease
LAKSPRAAALGAQAEAVLAAWFGTEGHQVLDRNWRVKAGEIDLVVDIDGVVVVVEVKARTSARFGTGLDAITDAKRVRLHRLAHAWLAANDRGGQRYRVDIASWVGGEWTFVHGI